MSKDLIPVKKRDLIKNFPTGLTKQFGCIRCEWRGTSRCPVGMGTLPRDNICDERIKWLYTMIPDDYTEPPGHERVTRDILLSVTKDRGLHYVKLIDNYTAMIEKKLEEGVDPSDLKHLYKQIEKFEYWANKYLTFATEKHDAQVGRETTRKSVSKVQNLKPSDVFQTYAKDIKAKEVKDADN